MNPCTETTYKVSVQNLGNGTYRLTQPGETTKTFVVPTNGSTVLFTGLIPGEGNNVTFENTSGCTSETASCPSSSARMATNSETLTQRIDIVEETKVLAYPNPFSNKVKFVVTSSITGKGILEVYDMLGQKVKTVYQGNITSGSQTFELNLPRQNLGNINLCFKNWR